MEGFPMRSWSIRIYLLNEQGEEIPATLFEKVTYKLHPTFSNPTPTIKTPPFLLKEEGWGEFDMEIVFHTVEKGGDHSIAHDLNFQKETYDAKHTLTFKNPKPALLKALAESGSVPGDAQDIGNGAGASASAKRTADSHKSKKKGTKTIDMDKLADGLQKLQEDDLLQVVQMVHDNKAPDTYIKNDVEQGEFHVDLYTLPDALIKMLWEYVTSKVEV
ncbi:hypothetical protein FGG08_000233 [Glutinoglossum americanum]|uniref:YEATS domain-containing protein n=1 Tax=Glutinoglossum americanum TaxID=1670608 RepID=A0A9P8I998_9PEZI|nr:hypothetical protein FGG08_000233 [Glutinoglossum americanum]